MKYRIQTNSDQTRVEVHLFGNVTGEEIIAINEEASNYLGCISQVWNFLEAVSVDVSPEEMHRIAMQDREYSLKMKVEKVAIVGSEAVLRGIGEMYEIFSYKWVGRPGGFISRTFASLDEAYKWVRNNEK